jgi:hypothetical protein
MPQHVSRHAAPRRRSGTSSAARHSAAGGPTGRHRRARPSETRTRVPSLATTAIAITAVSAAVVAGPQLAQRAESANATAMKPPTTSPDLEAAAVRTPAPATPSRPAIRAPHKDLAAPKNAVVTGDESVQLTSTTLRRLAAEKASRSRARLALKGDPKHIAAALLPSFGFGQDQMQCLIPMWTRESGWNLHAANASSGAYGIPQALPGGKMSKFGSDWQTNPATQIKWGLWYVKSRYGSPCGAWSFWQRNSWY